MCCCYPIATCMSAPARTTDVGTRVAFAGWRLPLEICNDQQATHCCSQCSMHGWSSLSGRSPHVGAQVEVVGRERLVLDLSCRKKDDGRYYVVTDRWQRFSELAVDDSTLADLGEALA